MMKEAIKGRWNSSGIGKKMTIAILSLFVIAIITTTSIVYTVFSTSYTDNVHDRLESIGGANTDLFMEWIDARRDEIRYIASLEATVNLDNHQLSNLFAGLAENNGHYDTIYFVNTDGTGVIGVSYDESANVLSPAEAALFQVHDRDWFQQAISGEEVFSQPLVSRATGNRVSNVVVPVRRNGNVIGVVRAAVMLDTLTDRLAAIERVKGTEIYMLDTQGRPITSSPSHQGIEQAFDTQAAQAISRYESGIDIYNNAAGSSVVGSYNFIPLLGWGLIVEIDESIALAEVNSVFWTILVVSAIILISAGFLIIVMIRRNITLPLQHSIDGLAAASEQVASASTQVSSSSQTLAEGSSEQAASLQETSSSLEEIASQTKQNSSNANQANRSMQESSEIVKKGVASMTRMSKAISEIMESSNETSKIVKTIDDIAFQTNLLALNAAVEAARAGEAGKGFAVVAEEVRTLAQRSADAARSTSILIEKSHGTAQNGVNVANEVAKQLNTISTSSDAVEVLIAEIAAASSEQTQGISQVSTAMSEMDKVVQSNAANSEETASAAEELSSLGAELKHMVNGLRSIVGGVQYSIRSAEKPFNTAEHYQSQDSGSWGKDNFSNNHQNNQFRQNQPNHRSQRNSQPAISDDFSSF